MSQYSHFVILDTTTLTNEILEYKRFLLTYLLPMSLSCRKQLIDFKIDLKLIDWFLYDGEY